jgi:hypothetical protein
VTRELTIGGYVVCLLVAVALAAIAHRRDAPFATLGEVLDHVFADRAVRITMIVFWWWLGWHFLVARTVDPPLG